MSTRSTTVRESLASSTARFEARARAARRRSRRPVVVAVGCVVVLIALAVFAWAGPLLSVRHVQVAGVAGAQAAQVAALARPEDGTPLAQVDTGRLTAEVARLAFVRAAHVERHWPSTLRVVVSARVPVAAVPRGKGFRLVDTQGVAYVTVAKAPDAVPVVRVPLTDSSRDTLDAALEVLEQMPASLRARVSQVSASTPDDVRMRLGKASVVWGSAADSALKSQVLADLVRHKAKVYDVSSPHTAVLR